MFLVGLTNLSGFTNAKSLNSIPFSCIVNVNVNGDEPVFFPFSIETSKRSGSCNNINYSYAQICVPGVVRNLNVKVFNLMLRTNETRDIEWHESCKRECKFGANVCNNKQHWNKDKSRCECKELIDKGVCDKGFIYLES